MPVESYPPDTSVIHFWGVRGSIPTPGPSTIRVGGNTTCVELRIAGQIIVIDAGSGIRALGAALIDEFGEKPIKLTLLSTHGHWDHIQGFPFFTPAYASQNRIHVIGQNSEPNGLRAVFEKQMDGSRHFPVLLGGMAAEIIFEHLDTSGDLRFTVGEVQVQACFTNHPGGCLAYRFETPNGSIVFLSDHETGGDDELRIIDFIKGAKILIADTQYNSSEIATRRGWGHGCVDEVVSLALHASAEKLYLFHHDPSHDDAFLDEMLQDAKNIASRAGSNLIVEIATEGVDIVV